MATFKAKKKTPQISKFNFFCKLNFNNTLSNSISKILFQHKINIYIIYQIFHILVFVLSFKIQFVFILLAHFNWDYPYSKCPVSMCGYCCWLGGHRTTPNSTCFWDLHFKLLILTQLKFRWKANQHPIQKQIVRKFFPLKENSVTESLLTIWLTRDNLLDKGAIFHLFN